MAEEDQNAPEQTLADEVTERYATHFSVAVSAQEVMLFFGKMDTSFEPDGSVTADRIVYDTKMQMSHEAARQLRDLLDANIGEGAEAREQ